MYYIYNNYLPGVWHNLLHMIDENYYEGDNTAVIMGTCHNDTKQRVMPELPANIDKVVVYQTEPLVEGHWHKPENIIKNLATYDEVWEFDYDNYKLLLSHGINAIFRPVKYTESLRRVVPVAEPDIDVLFYGSTTDHRNEFFKNFHERFIVPDNNEDYMRRFMKLSTMRLTGIDDSRLDEFISRSKIILNLQPYKLEDGEDRQSQVRIYYPLINGKCVVSEKSKRNYFGNSILEFTNYQECREIVMDLLLTGNWRNYPNNCSDCGRFVNREVLIENTREHLEEIENV